MDRINEALALNHEFMLVNKLGSKTALRTEIGFQKRNDTIT